MVVRSIVESCGVDSEIYQTCSFRVIFKMTLAMNINNLRHVLCNFLASFGIVKTFSIVIKHENTSNNLCWWFLRNILNAPHFEVFIRTFLQRRQCQPVSLRRLHRYWHNRPWCIFIVCSDVWFLCLVIVWHTKELVLCSLLSFMS